MIALTFWMAMHSWVVNAYGYVYHWPPPEPALLVPAVRMPKLIHAKGESFTCGFDWCTAVVDVYEPRDACADESRILLQAEDGTAWCLATPREVK